MTDYKLIADSDPGGDLQTAFDAMAAEVVTSTPEKLMTYLSIANEVGFTESGALEAAVNAAISGGQLPSWVRSALETKGIDINNPQTGPLLVSLVGEVEAAKILAAGVVSVKKFPSLTIQQLENARYAREQGAI